MSDSLRLSGHGSASSTTEWLAFEIGEWTMTRRTLEARIKTSPENLAGTF
jgi:hypothetical protein